MKPESYKRHVYDLELKSLFEQYKKGISTVQLNTTDKTPEYFVRLLKTNLINYCKLSKINFQKHAQIIITPIEDGAYRMFLSISLIFSEPHKIRQYLNYHEELFKSLTQTRDDFVGVIEFQIIDSIKAFSPFDNSHRLSEIMLWVESKKTDVNSESKKIDEPEMSDKNKSASSYQGKLSWTADQSMLKKLSEELFKKKYTSRKADFQCVFNENKRIEWHNNPVFLVYLIQELTKKPLDCINADVGRKPYWQAIEKYFILHDINGSEINNFKLADLLYKINKKNPEKFSKVITSVTATLKYVGLIGI